MSVNHRQLQSVNKVICSSSGDYVTPYYQKRNKINNTKNINIKHTSTQDTSTQVKQQKTQNPQPF